MSDHAEQHTDARPGARLLLTGACFVIVVYGLYEAQAVVVPFMLSIFLAIISAPAMFWLQRKGVPKSVAVVLVIFGVIGTIVGIGALVGTSIDDFSEAIPEYRVRLQEIGHSSAEWLRAQGIEFSYDELLEQIDPGSLMSLVSDTLKGVANMLSDTLLVMLTVVFILLEASDIPAKLRVALGDPKADISRFANVTTEVNRYLVIKTLVSLGTGVILGVWVWILGVDFPFLWGLSAFLLNFIPNLGSIIAAVPPVALALVQPDGGLGTALAVGLGYIAVNAVFGNVVEPHFMGRKLGLSSLVVFLSLVFWGSLWGPVGMFLSVPLTMIVKILLENSKDLKGIAVFLGPAPKETPSLLFQRMKERRVQRETDDSTTSEEPETTPRTEADQLFSLSEPDVDQTEPEVDEPEVDQTEPEVDEPEVDQTEPAADQTEPVADEPEVRETDPEVDDTEPEDGETDPEVDETEPEVGETDGAEPEVDETDPEHRE